MENRYLKRAAVLLFYSDPERHFTGAAIKTGYFEGKSDLRFQDEVCGKLFAQVSKAMDLLLTKYLKAIISYEGISTCRNLPGAGKCTPGSGFECCCPPRSCGCSANSGKGLR